MSWRYQNRKKTNRDEEGFFEDPFSFGFRTGFQDIDQLMDSMFRTAESLGSNSDSNTIFYGYQVNVGPDGKPNMRELGNVKPTGRGTIELDSREPFVDVMVNEKDQIVKVVGEMPGLQKEDINLQSTEDSLTIKARNKDRNYEITVPLDNPVEPDSAKATYRNGILEVGLKLKEDPKPKGLNIKVE